MLTPFTPAESHGPIAALEQRLHAFALACYGVVVHENQRISAARRSGHNVCRSAPGRLCLRVLNDHINHPLPALEAEAQGELFLKSDH